MVEAGFLPPYGRFHSPQIIPGILFVTELGAIAVASEWHNVCFFVKTSIERSQSLRRSIHLFQFIKCGLLKYEINLFRS